MFKEIIVPFIILGSCIGLRNVDDNPENPVPSVNGLDRYEYFIKNEDGDGFDSFDDLDCSTYKSNKFMVIKDGSITPFGSYTRVTDPDDPPVTMKEKVVSSNNERKYFPNLLSVTYKFDKYIDLPLEVINSESLSPKSEMTFEIEETEARYESKETTSEVGFDVSLTYQKEISQEVIGEVNLGVLVLSGSVTNSDSFAIETSLYGKIQNILKQETYYNRIVKKSYSIENTSNEYLYYDYCYRQKFEMYFTMVFEIDYKKTPFDNPDGSTFYNYTIESYQGVKTYLYLLPIENVYHELSVYHNDANGNKVIKDKTHSNILYF